MPQFLRDQKSKLYQVYDLLQNNKNIDNPVSFTVSPDGTYALVCDERNHCISRICLKTGHVSIFAGRSSINKSFRNGPKEQATFRYPVNLTFSPDGTFVLVCDRLNNCIRKVCLVSDEVSTFEGIPRSRGHKNGSKAQGTLGLPRHIVFSTSGTDVLICVLFNCIRNICIKSGQVTTFANSGQEQGYRNGPKDQALFFSQTSLTFSPDGKFALVCDFCNHCIRRICIKSGDVSTFSGIAKKRGFRNGLKEQAMFDRPIFLAFSPDATYILICDWSNHCIRKICLVSEVVSTFAGIPGVEGYRNGPKEQAKFSYPSNLTFSQDGKFVIICDKNRIRYIKIKN